MNKLIAFFISIINVFFVWLFVTYDMAKNWLTKSLKRLVVAKVNAPGGNAMHWYRYCH